jgi:hypothetical protein
MTSVAKAEHICCMESGSEEYRGIACAAA